MKTKREAFKLFEAIALLSILQGRVQFREFR
jgi:hypothetical protein